MSVSGAVQAWQRRTGGIVDDRLRHGRIRRPQHRRRQMLKTTVLAVLVGLATAATTLPSAAQFIAAKVPGGPNYPASADDDEECAYQLTYMPRVTQAHIESIGHQHVYLIPVCEDGLIGRNDDYGWLFTSGNVGTLRLP